MKFVILQHTEEKPKKKEDILYLKLMPMVDKNQDGVRIVACNEDGLPLFCGNILSITDSGVYIYPGLTDLVNIKKAPSGKIAMR